MGMPVISINFKEAATNTIARSDRGILLLILRDTVPDTNPAVVTSVGDIPSGITETNTNYIKLALLGGETSPQKIYCYFVRAAVEATEGSEGVEAEDITEKCLPWAETKHIDWVAMPTATTESAVKTIADWVQNLNKDSNNFIMAVLPNSVSNDKNIVNWAVEGVTCGDTTYTAEQYSARIAGLIAGTPLTSSVTYAVLDDADSCTSMTKSAMDEAVNAGKLICFWDGEKVKLGRGVNSLTDPDEDKGEGDQFKKIKIAETMNTIKYDLFRTMEDSYVGKYANVYANRVILLTAVQDYFDTLVADSLVSSYTADFDVDAIKAAMKSAGIDYSDMTDDEIIKYDFGTTVYIAITCRMVDAIEDITINIAI